jgi:hypothetical protein
MAASCAVSTWDDFASPWTRGVKFLKFIEDKAFENCFMHT